MYTASRHALAAICRGRDQARSAGATSDIGSSPPLPSRLERRPPRSAERSKSADGGRRSQSGDPSRTSAGGLAASEPLPEPEPLPLWPPEPDAELPPPAATGRNSMQGHPSGGVASCSSQGSGVPRATAAALRSAATHGGEARAAGAAAASDAHGGRPMRGGGGGGSRRAAVSAAAVRSIAPPRRMRITCTAASVAASMIDGGGGAEVMRFAAGGSAAAVAGRLERLLAGAAGCASGGGGGGGLRRRGSRAASRGGGTASARLGPVGRCAGAPTTARVSPARGKLHSEGNSRVRRAFAPPIRQHAPFRPSSRALASHSRAASTCPAASKVPRWWFLPFSAYCTTHFLTDATLRQTEVSPPWAVARNQQRRALGAA